ncbi:uncharacterized protein LOC118325475, partial [Morone saxatilis]|uniref:uncharacterized protein LOC118325475 n=1 Tax=Morone saxatilis TaxID=34816 RepID=UPI0015E1D653
AAAAAAAARGKCRSHAPHGQVPEPQEPNGEAGRGVRERCRSSNKPAHRHHHRRKHNREDRPPPAAPEPEHPRRCHTHSRPVPRVPSLSDSTDDRAPLCEPRELKGASSPSPSSCSLVPLSSRSSRRSRRSSAASSASDINLRTILNSLFGQPAGVSGRAVEGKRFLYTFLWRCVGLFTAAEEDFSKEVVDSDFVKEELIAADVVECVSVG